jgi:hypothetical protein
MTPLPQTTYELWRESRPRRRVGAAHLLFSEADLSRSLREMEATLRLLSLVNAYFNLLPLLSPANSVSYRDDSSSEDVPFEADPDDEFRECILCEGAEIFAVNKPWHVLFLILNIFAPGVGTILSSSGCFHVKRPGPTETQACYPATFCDGVM